MNTVQLDAQIARRRVDQAFMARLAEICRQDAAVLARLAKT